MAFNLFKKKETLDLTKKGIDSDVPTDGYFKRKGKIPSASSSIASSLTSTAIQASSQETSPSSSTSTQSSGGFFNFFGGSDSSSSSSSTNSVNSPSSYYSNNSSTSSSTIDTDKLKTQLDDLLYRFSRLTDRVELLEKKMDRFERKDNPSY